MFSDFENAKYLIRSPPFEVPTSTSGHCEYNTLLPKLPRLFRLLSCMKSTSSRYSQ
jgi:hypothetical protein